MPVMKDPDAPPDILGDLTSELLLDWTFDKVPEVSDAIPVEHECRIVQNFQFTDRRDGKVVRLEIGMQGRLIKEMLIGGQPGAFIDIPGATQGTFYKGRWVPRNIIEVGPPRKEIKDWDIHIVSLLGTRFSSVAKIQLATTQAPDDTVFGKTVYAMMEAIFHERLPFVHEDVYTDINTWGGTANISKEICKGVQRAGLYNMFNSGSFTMQQLWTTASTKLPAGQDQVYAGVYIRWSKSHAAVLGAPWDPNTSYIYVGHSKNMDDRYRSHQSEQGSYGTLNRHSDVRSFALCILPNDSHRIFLYAAEQVLMCMLQSWRKSIYKAGPVQDNHPSLICNAKMMYALSKTVFAETGWQGGERRIAFGVDQGANLSLPVQEYKLRGEATSWIRTDSHAAHPETGETMPMAYFRRTRSLRNPDHESHSLPVLRLGNFSLFCMLEAGLDRPAKGQMVQIVIEIRKDMRPHPRSLMRLPYIPRFRNWEQAQSLGIRIEWEDLQHPGKWRFQYFSRRIHELRNNNIPASFETYAKAIEILQCMLHTRPSTIPNWIVQPYYANIIMAVYDHMRQIVTFRPINDEDRVVIKSCARLPAKEIEAEMRIPGRLGQVGSYTTPAGSRATRLPSCDICKLYLHHNNTCNPNANGQCQLCWKYGLPYCSWTSDTANGSDEAAAVYRGTRPPNIGPDKFATMTRVYTALWSNIRNPTEPERFQGFNPGLMRINISEDREIEEEDTYPDE